MNQKKAVWGIGGVIVLIILVTFIMSWLYPFSHFSVNKSITYNPGKVLYDDDQTYQDLLNEFKESFGEDLNNEREKVNNDFNLTIDRTQYILPVFEQNWLIETKPVTIDKNKLDQMLFDVKQTRDSLLDLAAEEDYTREERGYLIDNIHNLLRLEENITQLKHGDYFSRRELDTLLGNLRNDFRSSFNFFVTFYERSTGGSESE